MKTQKDELSAPFLKFLDESPTAWHAVQNCILELEQAGFQELKEQDPWHLKPGISYFVTRNGSSLCCFTLPKKEPSSLRIAASHTDSPSFKIKPNAEFSKENIIFLGLEVYGAPLLTSWLNRDLGIAGRILFTDEKDHIQEQTVCFEEYPLVIPQLAIHLDREVNEKGLVLNKQEHLAAIATIGPQKNKTSYLESLLRQKVKFKELLSYDLYLFPLDKARLFENAIKTEKKLIASYRIDNLCGVFAALIGMISKNASKKKSKENTINMAVFWDSEETGSATAQGAESPFVMHIIERIALSLNISRETCLQWMSRSLSVSIDSGHALHPLYPEKAEPRHAAHLNEGLIIKYNAQNRYASDARSSAKIVHLCQKHKIPFQKYVSRGDIPCGSTVGPIHAKISGIPTVDLGVPQISMHSCRELMGANDLNSLCKLLVTYFREDL